MSESMSAFDRKIILIILALIAIGALLFLRNTGNKEKKTMPSTQESAILNDTPSPAKLIEPEINPQFRLPLSRAAERNTKKNFGILIDPQTSPVQPEKFAGYHTGVDFEIFDEEWDVEVGVSAVCSGQILLKKYAAGYGGVVVQKCFLDNNPITVIYGHLNLASVRSQAGESISTGDTLGILGKGFSRETSGERKHLHLGFHKGSEVNILGYVSNKKDLSDWIDPCEYFCQK